MAPIPIASIVIGMTRQVVVKSPRSENAAVRLRMRDATPPLWFVEEHNHLGPGQLHGGGQRDERTRQALAVVVPEAFDRRGQPGLRGVWGSRNQSRSGSR